MSQFACLLWKERRQARFVLGGCLLAAVLIPLAIIFAGSTVAESGQRWFLREEAVGAIVPGVCALALWPLIALIAAVQLFGGDAAGGTERLLRHAPVPAARVWLARLVLGASALLACVTVSLICWWSVGTLLAPSGFERIPDLPGWLVASALLLGPLALACGALACSLRTHSLAALLVGGGLTAGLAAGGVRLASLSPWLAPLLAPVGGLAIVVLLACSFVMDARGEPAGRGRFRRGGWCLAAGLATVTLATVMAAPIYLRSSFGVKAIEAVEVSPSGERALAQADGSVWLIDLASGRRTTFFPPYVLAAAWEEDGRRLALASSAGKLGTLRRDPLLLVVDGASGRELSRHALPAGFWPYQVLWWRGHVVLHGAIDVGEKDVQQWTLLLEPLPGAAPRRIAAGPFRPRAVVRATADGPLMMLMPDKGAVDGDANLHALQLDRPDADPAAAGAVDGALRPDLRGWLGFTVSPSGRYRWRTAGEDNDRLAIDGLAQSEAWLLERAWAAGLHRRPPRCWLGGDRLAWLQGSGPVPERLMISAADGATLAAIPFTESVTWLACEPGGNRVLAYRYGQPGEQAAGGGQAVGAAEGWIADADSGTVRPLPGPTEQFLTWAGRGWLMGRESRDGEPYLVSAAALDRKIPLR